MLLRHTPAVLIAKLRKLFEPALDPARVQRTFAQYDQQRGYAAHHVYCRSRCTRPAPEPAACALLDQGFQTIEVMSPDAAGTLLARVRAGSAIAKLKYDSDRLEGYRIDDPQLREAVLSAALCAPVDALATRFFRSEYFVHWFTLSRTDPAAARAPVSFRWHCDKGPREHLKLLLYLNDPTEHGGGTAFMNLADTAAVARSGYLFARGHDRTTDPGELSRLAGHALSARECRPRAGAAVLFQPARVLHSGITPTRGPRYVLTVCLLPSPVPWRDALRRGMLSDLAIDPLWHADASALRERFAAPG
ncbi:MAG: 2OG-Fe(II) oxygenase [Gammaproteobacteria bacterium]|nr:2OG-Fe(II) oxygenase [Gammaproteobacteria bacterium]